MNRFLGFITIGGVVIANLIVAMTAQLFVVAVIGVGGQTDSYLAAQAVPMVLSSIIISAVQTVWLPILSAEKSNSGALEIKVSCQQSQAFLLCIPALLVGVFSAVWVPLLFGGFKEDLVNATVQLSYLFFFVNIVNVLTNCLFVQLRAKDDPLKVELIYLLGNCLFCASLILFLKHYGIEFAAWMSVARSAVMLVVALHFCGGFRFDLSLAIKNSETWRLKVPILLGTGLYKTSPVYDRFLVSRGAVGSITILSYALTIMSAGAAVIERAIMLPRVPRMARLITKAEFKAARKLCWRCLVETAAIVLFIGSMVTVFQSQVVYLVAELLNFSEHYAHLFWLSLLALTGFLYCASVGSFLVQTFSALNDTKTPMKTALISFFLSLGFKYLFFESWGVVGLLYGISAYYILSLALMVFLLEVKFSKLVVSK